MELTESHIRYGIYHRVNQPPLAISGDGLGPQYIKVDSLEFLRELTSLRFFSLLTERLRDRLEDREPRWVRRRFEALEHELAAVLPDHLFQHDEQGPRREECFESAHG